uniref:JmjC domain-containing protein n=1 Tax=viral metagenome TaxID=1070528 RepID=A0A6C0AZU2_9ZZZZ
MNIIIIILIFCLVLFLYLHIYFHLKTSDDLEVLEILNPSKERLEEICDLRQPILFDFNIQSLINFNKENILQNYGSFDIKLRNILNTYSDPESELFLPVTLKDGLKVLEEDEQSKFISENNHDFLEETSLIKNIKANDEFLRPNMMSSNYYDFILGSSGSITPFRYDINYRNYFVILSGCIKVKMTPPRSSKYLYPIKDYDNFEFRSPINPWNVQDQYKKNFDKIKCLELTLQPGKILFIPAYWWYSLKFEDNKTRIISFKYRTYMNTVAVFPSIFISFLQKQNIKHNIIEKINIIE